MKIRYYSLELSQDKKSVIGCKPNAKRVKIPYGVEVIEEDAFAYCLHIESVKLPETLKIIKNRAFLFTRIKKIYIPASVTQIDQDAFLESTFLNEIIVDQNNPIYSSQDGILFNKTKENLITFPPFKIGDPLVIPDTVKCVKNGALPKFPFIFSLVINKNLEEIDRVGLQYCLNLKNIIVHQENQNFFVRDGLLFDKNSNQLFDFIKYKTSRKLLENNLINNDSYKINQSVMYRSVAIICTKKYLDYFKDTITFSSSDKCFRSFLNDVDRIGEVLLRKKHPHQMLGVIMSRFFGDEIINVAKLISLVELGHLKNLSLMDLFTLLWYVSSKNVLTYSESFYLLMSEKRVVAKLLEAIFVLYKKLAKTP